MDFIWDLLDRFQQTVFFATMQKLSPLDWIVVFAVLFGMLRGSKQGLGETLGKLLELALVGALVLTFNRAVFNYLGNKVPMVPDAVMEPVSFILLAVFLWLPLSWIFKILGKFARFEVSGAMKFFGGMVFGGLYAFLLLSFLSQFLLFFPIESLRRAYERGHSYTGRALAKTFPKVREVVAIPLQLTGKVSRTPQAD